MRHARWTLGALGALAVLSVAPALPASADSVLITKITNVADGSRWSVTGPDAAITTLQPHSTPQPRSVDQWVVTKQADGSMAIKSWDNRQCATAEGRAGGELRTAACDPADAAQDWTLNRRNDGTVVISPKSTPSLVVSIQQPPSKNGTLQLTEREQVTSNSTRPDHNAMDSQAFKLDI
ncbi:RICIN domain-containing protein [Saccharopolyspora mangrovi]|uniref:RICIN domain-containing protein n=1 Tax=Saccharopolyspora mangrovi TaxID=3082379 RepID=A0ABU6ALM6_9PSEU|nr:RICIN domain-containing protein [Saccharopolyspora sp. S2-29]MEB3372361.1 RICIN domain-containing protein [Saccharopolyspora sp. S2-29]